MSDNPIYIDRPPRIQPTLPEGEITINPPPKNDDRSRSLWQVALPAVTIAGYLLISIFGGRRMLLIIPMTLSVVVSIIFSYHSMKKDKKKQEEKRQAYDEYLIEQRREMMAKHDLQRRFYRHNYPAPMNTLLIANDSSRLSRQQGGSDVKITSRLWERRSSDSDFCTVRLGVGTLQSLFRYAYKDGGNIDDLQTREALRLVEDSHYVTEAPITIPLRQGNGTSDARYSIGVAGDDTGSIYSFLWSLVTNYVTFQAPTDAMLFILGLETAEPSWQWIKNLPHARGIENLKGFCFESVADRSAEKNESNVVAFLKGLRKVIDGRSTRLRDKDQAAGVSLPHILLIVDLLGSMPEDSLFQDLETDPAISSIIQQGAAVGVSVLFLVSSINKVPSGCQSVIELTMDKQGNDVATQALVRFRYSEVGVNTPRYTGEADSLKRPDMLTKFAKALEPLTVRKSYGADLPRTVHMMDMLGVQTMEEAHVLIRDNWKKSRLRPANKEKKDGQGKISYEMDYSGWLQSKLGMLSGSDYRTLRFSADADGVHGLIAGSTGSGKSELLMTMILNMTIRYDPSIVNFVLVDFKGGGAFKPLENLPHVVDMVTNLSESAVERMFAAIKAELDRRSSVNTATNMKHLVEYRKYGLHEPDEHGQYGRSIPVRGGQLQTAPYPHLFIFIDEFAEMIASNPEYKAQLNSITRLGRALGVTLILAAQRPTGVTDQMRANIKFRIALRVETREESSEILRRSDAAYLPTGIPGRGYLQIGNENIELIQVAWSGAPYTGSRVNKQADVIWLKNRDRPTTEQELEEPPKVFEEMVTLIGELAKTDSIPQRKPWPKFLPKRMSLQTLVDAYYLEDEQQLIGDIQEDEVMLNRFVSDWMNTGSGSWQPVEWREKAMKAVVGLIDNPYQSEQLPLVVDFRRGHGVVFSASGWGKTTFLRTTLTTLAVTHSPQELHAYIFDFGGRQMSVFRDLPHVGAIITPDQEEKVKRLLRKLASILDNRKKHLSELGEDDLYSYNTNNPDNILPAVLVIIDNFAEFKESFENLVPALISIVREARAYGLHFLVSAESPSAITGKLYGLLTERMALKLSDPTEYTGIVGRGARNIDDIPGRGFVKVDRRALEFQTALPVGNEDDFKNERETQQLLALIQIMNKVAPVEGVAESIEILPRSVDLEEVILPLPKQDEIRPIPAIEPYIGTSDLTLKRWALNLRKDGPHCIVIGSPNTGKTTLLRTFVLSLAHSYTPNEVMIVLADMQQRLFNYDGDSMLSDLPHVVETLGNTDNIMTFVDSLRHECELNAQLRKPDRRAIFVIIDNFTIFSEDASETKNVMPQLTRLAREFGPTGLHFILGGAPDLLRTTDGLRRQVQVTRYGISMDAESVQRLNGRISRSLTQTELPTGRSFVVKAGRTSMVQVATPYTDPDNVELSLDLWMEKIMANYEGVARLEWQYEPPPPSDEDDPIEEPGTNGSGTPSGDPEKLVGREVDGRFIPTKKVPEQTDIATMRKELEQYGMLPLLIEMMSDGEVYDTITQKREQAKKKLDDQKQTESEEDAIGA